MVGSVIGLAAWFSVWHVHQQRAVVGSGSDSDSGSGEGGGGVGGYEAAVC